ncbi:MAG: ring-hydroxylating oxygenase subunit alpha [Pseudomonadota bacterium]|nr:ring-hydroxylating oxygenase subunit alpha [Pseudomonadota bacterium]
MTRRLTENEFDHISQGYDPVASRSGSIHSDCYLDAHFLDVEREQVFHRTWQFVCHEEKLREPGSYVAGDVQGQSIFVARDSNGELRAFYNVCRHRGHELLSGEGQVSAITCPYHAWVYNLDGSLRRARRSELIENFCESDIHLAAIQVETFCHLIFVNLDTDAGSLAQQSGDLGKEVLSYAPDLGNLTFAHRLTYQPKANWKAVVDNFLECYHCPVAHKNFVTLVEMDTYKVKTHGIYSSHMAKAGRRNNQAYAVDSASVTDHAVWYLWPNTTLMRYPGRGNFMVWRFIPVGPEETYEEFDFFFESTPPTDTEMEAIDFIDTVLQPEDINLVESVQRGMRTPAFNQGRYLVDPEDSGMSEHGVHHFHGLVLDAYRRACQP